MSDQVNGAIVLIPQDDPSLELHIKAIKKWYRLAQLAFSPNTLSAYRFDLRLWISWCRHADRHPLPAKPEDVCDYIEYLAAHYKPASIKRFIQSLSTLNQAADAPAVLEDKFVQLAMRGVRRSKGVEQDQAEPIHYSDIEALQQKLGWIDPITRTRRYRLADIRNITLMMVGYDTLLRGSELTRLRAEDIDYRLDGSAVIKVRRSKNDGEGEGAYKYLRPLTARLLKKWLEAIGVSQGYIFWSLSTKGEPIKAPITLQGLRNIYTAMMEHIRPAGDAPAAYSSHSTRIGACQDLFLKNFSLGRIMYAGTWKDPRMPVHYNRKAEPATSAMAELAKQQTPIGKKS